MATAKLTQRSIEKLKAPHPSGKQVLLWDSELKGFGVLVSGTSNVRSYIVQGRLKDKRTRRVTVGPVNVLNLDKAREEARKIIGQFYKGDDPKDLAKRRSQRNQTLQQALDSYLAGRKDLSPKSRSLYKSLVIRHLASWLSKPLATITPDLVEEKHTAIKKAVDRGPEQKGTVKTTGEGSADSVFRTFRAIYNFACDRDDSLPPNPVRRLKRSWYGTKRRETLVPLDRLAEFHAAVCKLESRTASDFLRLVLWTGLRRNEAAALKWSEIDFAEKAIRLPASRTKARRKLDLPMSDYVYDLLVARRAIGIEGEYVFAASSKSGHLEEPRFHLTEVAKSTGVSVTTHDLRRTFITVAESSNISVMALKGLVNHSLGSDVTSGYVQMTIDRLREPAQIIADRMKTLCGIEPVEAATPIRAARNRKGKGKIVRKSGSEAQASSTVL